MPTQNHVIALNPPRDLPFLRTLIVQNNQCPYLKDKRANRTIFASPAKLTPLEFRQCLDAGMRRSGSLVYRPLCEGCRKCIPLRIRVEDFKPSRSQQRVSKRCDPLFAPYFELQTVTKEKVELYQRYQASKHKEQLTLLEAEQAYKRFLGDSCVETRELQWRTQAGKLVGVGILDVGDVSLSSVYFYWDPDFSQFSLGTYSVIREIHLAKTLGLAYYYLGYYVPGSAAMEYKLQFGPAEIWNGTSFEVFEKSKKIEELELSCMLKDSQRFDMGTSFEL